MSRALDRLVEGLALLAGLALALLVGLLCLDVAVRYAQVVNIPWIGDAASIGLYAITFLAAPWVLRDRGHIAVDSVVKALPDGVQRVMRPAVNLLGAAVCVILTVYAIRVLLASYETGTQVFRMLVYPQWWLFTLPPLTFGLMAILFVRLAWRGE